MIARFCWPRSRASRSRGAFDARCSREPADSSPAPRRSPGCSSASDRIPVMTNPLLEMDSLPAFGRIRPEHARPALEAVLAENRARLAELTAQADPTFASLVAPVEELSYRLSRVWSPVAHLNGVQNSPEMRAAYNECVPLLTAYHSELGQNAALQRAYAQVLEHERASLDGAQVKLLENALRDFRLAGVDLAPQAKE